MGAHKEARVGARPHPPPLENEEKIILLYGGGGLFVTFFSYWGTFMLLFSLCRGVIATFFTMWDHDQGRLI